MPNILLRLTPQLHRAAGVGAAVQGVSLQKYLVAALESAVAAQATDNAAYAEMAAYFAGDKGDTP